MFQVTSTLLNRLGQQLITCNEVAASYHFFVNVKMALNLKHGSDSIQKKKERKKFSRRFNEDVLVSIKFTAISFNA